MEHNIETGFFECEAVEYCKTYRIYHPYNPVMSDSDRGLV